MFSKKVIVFAKLLLLLNSPSWAHPPEQGKVTAAIGPWFYQTLPSFDLPHSENLDSLGVMLLANADVDTNGGVEVAFAYLNRKYYRKIGASIIGQEADKFLVMVGYRHWFFQNFSGALLIHSAYSMGEPNLIFRNSAAAFDTAAAKPAYNGLDLSFQYDYEFQETKFWVLDVRYSYSFDFEDDETPSAVALLLAYKQVLDVD